MASPSTSFGRTGPNMTQKEHDLLILKILAISLQRWIRRWVIANVTGNKFKIF